MITIEHTVGKFGGGKFGESALFKYLMKMFGELIDQPKSMVPNFHL